MKKETVYKNNKYEVWGTPESDSIFVHQFRPEYATIIALRDGRLVMVKQYREAMGQDTYELPGGAIEAGETPEQAARRELVEETGLICGELMEVGKIQPYACLINRIIHFFFTKEILEQREQNLDFDENIEIQSYAIDEAFSLIADGSWPDSETAHGLLLARLKGLL